MRAIGRASFVNSDVFDRCAEEVRCHDPDRFYAGLFAPERARKRLFALYAFNLEIARVRERVSEPMLGEVRLQWWREALDRIFAGHPLRHDVSEALAQTIEVAHLPRGPFDALIEARRFDLYDDPMESEAALAAYARATASGLVQLAAQVLTVGPLSSALLEATDAAGRAIAYTGILRALPLHASRRQFFLPQDRFVAAGGEAESVFAGKTSPALSQSLGALAALARAALDEARRNFARAGKEVALPAFLALAVIGPILTRLERPGFDPFRDSAELQSLSRLARLTSAGLLGRF